MISVPINPENHPEHSNIAVGKSEPESHVPALKIFSVLLDTVAAYHNYSILQNFNKSGI